ncbi:hypothetical protein [Halalkalibacter flavus]|uniref:hypothetical protein n=1 Tax=Halalkalibacter flavus TaxID=3090668 RepID=UPI002FCBD6D6
MKIISLLYVIMNDYRQSNENLKYNISRFSPSLCKFTNFFIISIAGFNFIFLFFLINIDLSKIPFIHNLGYLPLYIIYLISTNILVNNIFNNTSLAYKTYHYVLYNFHLIISNRLAIYALLMIQILFMKIMFNSPFFLPTIISGLLITVLVYYLDYVNKLQNFKRQMIVINSILSLIVLLILAIDNHLFAIELQSFKEALINISILFTVCLFMELCKSIYRKQREKNIHILIKNKLLVLPHSYLLLICLSLLLLLKDNEFLQMIHVELVFLIFFLNLFALKHRVFIYFSFESLRQFLFYLKNINYNFKSLLLGNIRMFLFIISPHFIVCITYFILTDKFTVISLFIAVIIFDVIVGLLLTLIYPTNMLIKDKIKLVQNSYIHKSTSLIVGIVITFIIQKIIHNYGGINLLFNLEISTSMQMTLLYLIIGFLLFTVLISVYLIFIWSNGFLEKLSMDNFKVEERE